MLPSPPSRRRGLKYQYIHHLEKCLQVASFSEAWIEILVKTGDIDPYESPPSRRRGLKFTVSVGFMGHSMSPPSRRRGLTSFGKKEQDFISNVASFSEAWIEINRHHVQKRGRSRRLLLGGVD